jgi:hypothetical protein
MIRCKIPIDTGAGAGAGAGVTAAKSKTDVCPGSGLKQNQTNATTIILDQREGTNLDQGGDTN